MAKNEKFLSKMWGLFSSREHNKTITPDIPQLTGNKKNFGRGRQELPSTTPLSILWNYFLTEQYDTYETLKFRENRYNDIDFAVKNSPIIQMAADLYADEAVQCQDIGNPVRVNASSAIQKDIQELLDKWGIDQSTVRETIWNKVVFGDAFDTNEIDEKEGIVGITPITVWNVKDRLEFDPSRLLEYLRNYNNNSGATAATKLQALMYNLEKEKGSPSSFFKKYLLGYELEGGHMVSPWTITHYRSYSMLREFAPWGRSQFINLLPAFRQLMSSEQLMQVARASSFPRDLYSVATEPGASTTEKWEALEEFAEQLDNAGLTQGAKETPSIGSRLIVPKDLVDYEQLTSTIDLDQIADIEYERDNLIMGTFIPKGYLIVDQGGWGTSGQSLLQQFKPFGRKVFSHQSDYLAGLTEKIKLHFAITGKYQGFDTPFELVMDFPVIEETTDRLSHRRDEIELAKGTIENIRDVLGVDNIPPEIVKDAFSRMTSLPQKTVDMYVNELLKANETTEEETQGDTNSKEYWERAEKKRRKIQENYAHARKRFKEQGTKDILIENSIKLKAKLRLYEGQGDQTHYYSSLTPTRDNLNDRKIFEALNSVEVDGRKQFLRESIAKEDLKKASEQIEDE